MPNGKYTCVYNEIEFGQASIPWSQMPNGKYTCVYPNLGWR